MKRLLVMTHPGVVDVNRTLFQELAAVSEVEITMIVPEAWRGDLIQDLRFKITEADQRLRIIPLPAVMSGNGSLFFYRAPLRKVMKNWAPDFIFVDEEPWSLAGLQAFLAFGRKPICFFTKQNLKKRVPPPFRWIEHFLFSRAKFAFSVASEVTEVLRWKGFSKTIYDLPHSFDPLIFNRPEPRIKAATRQELGLPVDRKIIGYFGRLTEEKGIDDLLAAQRNLLQGGSNDFFLWVGNGPYAEKVSAFCSEFPNSSKLIPAIPHHQVGRALACIDVLALPSRTTRAWKEQFGRILVEAMACGVACIGSDSGEIPHLIRRCRGGISFPEKNIPALTQALHEFTHSQDLMMAQQAGHEFVHQNLTHVAVARYLARTLGLPLRETS